MSGYVTGSSAGGGREREESYNALRSKILFDGNKKYMDRGVYA